MKNYLKFLVVTLLLPLSLTITSCGSSDDDPTDIRDRAIGNYEGVYVAVDAEIVVEEIVDGNYELRGAGIRNFVVRKNPDNASAIDIIFGSGSSDENIIHGINVRSTDEGFVFDLNLDDFVDSEFPNATTDTSFFSSNGDFDLEEGESAGVFFKGEDGKEIGLGFDATDDDGNEFFVFISGLKI